MVWFKSLTLRESTTAMLNYIVEFSCRPHLLSFSIFTSSIILSLFPRTLWIKMLRVWHHAIFSTVTLRNSSVRLENMIHTTCLDPVWDSSLLLLSPSPALGGWITFHISVTQHWIQTLGISSVSSVPLFLSPLFLCSNLYGESGWSFSFLSSAGCVAAAVLCLQGGTRSCSGVCGVSGEKHLNVVGHTDQKALRVSIGMKQWKIKSF